MNDTTQPNKMETDNTGTSRSKTGIIVAVIIAVLALAVYGGGVFYYSGHFPHNTTINHIKVGEMTVPEAEKAFTKQIASHKISIKEKERTEVINAADVDTQVDVGNQISDVASSMNPWLWFTCLSGEKDYTIRPDVTFDKNKLTELVNELECFKKENITKPQDAYLKAGETQFEIVPEVLGNKVKKDELQNAVEKNLVSGATSIHLEKEGLYKLPEYYAKDDVVKQALEKANQFTHGSVTYDFKYTTETVDYNTSKDWIKVSKDFKVTLNKDKIGDYVEQLGAKYNTMGASRNFTTAYGSKIHVYGGDYGWKIYFDKEKSKLIKNIKSGENITREPVYSYKGVCRNSAKDDIGDSYVEVSIQNQELWLFKKGKCILNSSIVTGDPTKGHSTYTGVYSITYKQSPATLTGGNAAGGSYSSDVTFWMPFNGGQGLHDAHWRSSFGGSIYRGNGSHGCVNCPYSTAATLYKHVKAGFPVVIY